jgi:hypothetical protein
VYHYDETDFQVVSPHLQITPSDLAIDEDEIRISEPQSVLAAQFLNSMVTSAKIKH